MFLASVAQVSDLLDELEIPNAQLMWEDQKPPQPPYVVLVPHETVPLRTGQGNAFEARNYDIELYAKRRDILLEKRIAAALKQAEISYTSDVAIDEKGQVAITYFSMTLVE